MYTMNGCFIYNSDSHPCMVEYALVMYTSKGSLFVLFSPSNSDEDSPSDDAKTLLADVRDQLLQGLADDAEDIR